MRFRSVTQEYEAALEPLTPTGHPKARGKAEWKVYADGTRQGRVSVSSVDLPDGALLELVIAGDRIAQLTIAGGRARYKRATERGEDVRFVEAGQALQVVHGGQVILAGTFRAE